MLDCNTTAQAIDIATNRLNWYIGLSIFASCISIFAVIVSIIYNRKQLEKSDERHESILNHSIEQLNESNKRHKEAIEYSIKIMEANQDFSKRSFTTTLIKDFVNNLNEARKKLDELTAPEKEVIKDDAGTFINFTTWIEANKKLLPKTLHEWVCEEDGQKEYKKVAKADYDPCVTTKEKEEIVITILHIINIYEQIGISLKNDVVDSEILSNTFKAPIKRNYELYNEYIQHRIEQHGDENFGKYFKWAYEELYKDERDTQRESASKLK
jgi:hypothetical protein